VEDQQWGLVVAAQEVELQKEEQDIVEVLGIRV
jgi:hypothetical protein